MYEKHKRRDTLILNISQELIFQSVYV